LVYSYLIYSCLHCILGNVSYCSWCHETSVCFLFNCWKI